MEFGVGVGERRDGSSVDAILHRDDSLVVNPEGYTFNLSAENLAASGKTSLATER